ncbi:MAG TPA: AtpZ/AtpI family protein [Deltaproteobacteria bacterium]|jgi:F0F1-type ATP synthase assembly protein I|nr:AtpZ/AtpI family protein [Deltaproteobacteria bacterium]HQI02791.1 AtpZ/AtpI family protein [Deltaproteobacteria bacterium]HQJ07686.1 AtpZ/AtpI family protein [Deltaproteobacteria bacterium]
MKELKKKREKVPRALANRLSRISAYSLVLVIMTFLGLYAGLWLDRLTGMAPNFTLLLLIVGIVLGFKGFIEEVILERRAKA